MKKIYTSLVCLFFAPLLYGCGANNRIVVEVTLDSIAGAKYDGQMAYLFAVKFSSLRLIDSCEIKDNSILFDGILPDGDRYGYITTSGKSSHRWRELAMFPGARIRVTLKDQNDITAVSGSPDTQAWLELQEELEQHGVFYCKYRDSLPKITNEALRQQIKDSIAYYDLGGVYHAEYERKFIYSLRSGCYAGFNFNVSRSFFDSIFLADIADSLRRKFPENQDLRIWLDGNIAAIQHMDHSDTVATNFERKLLNRPPLQPRETKPIVKATEEVAAYRIGDIVSDFTLPGYGSQPAKLSDSKAPYVFIDFWATWCGPCRNEIPHVVAAKQKYGKELDVFAVSLDYYSDAWKKYIDENDLSDFTHVLLLNDNPLKPGILARFGCSAIPRNFLLDKDRRIIAIDLRGEALEQKMKELTIE